MPLNQNISSLIKWLWVAEGINQQCRAAAHTTRTSCGLQIKFTRFSYYFDSKSFSLWRFVRCLRRFDTLNTKQKKTWHLAISRFATTREEEKIKFQKFLPLRDTKARLKQFIPLIYHRFPVPQTEN